LDYIPFLVCIISVIKCTVRVIALEKARDDVGTGTGVFCLFLNIHFFESFDLGG
jgi:hypothetical protein